MKKKFSLVLSCYLDLTFFLMFFLRDLLAPLDLQDSPVALEPR